MRILITGSRDWNDRGTLIAVMTGLQREFAPIKPGRADHDCSSWVIVHGACPTGADEMVEEWAVVNWITVDPHPADWARFGKRAGPVRNAEMVDAGADLCIAFYQRGARNRGTAGCAALARDAGIQVRDVWSTTEAGRPEPPDWIRGVIAIDSQTWK